MIFMKILKNEIQIKIIKMLITFDDMIPDMLSNKTFQQIVRQFFN